MTAWTLGPWSHVIRGYFDSGDEIWSLGNEDDPIQFPVADYAAGGEPESWDRDLIALAPEMAEAILTAAAGLDPDHYCGEDECGWCPLLDMASKLSALGKEAT